jgi:hypothetical protein
VGNGAPQGRARGTGSTYRRHGGGAGAAAPRSRWRAIAGTRRSSAERGTKANGEQKLLPSATTTTTQPALGPPDPPIPGTYPDLITSKETDIWISQGIVSYSQVFSQSSRIHVQYFETTVTGYALTAAYSKFKSIKVGRFQSP